MNYNVGDYLLHRRKGVSIVESYDDSSGNFVLRFEDGQTENFTEYHLKQNTQLLSPNGFRVLCFQDTERAKGLLIDDPVQAIVLTLKDFPYQIAKTPEIREIIEPYADNWEEWWQKTQPQIKDSPLVDSSRSNRQEYRLSESYTNSAEYHYEQFILNKRTLQDDEKAFEHAFQALSFFHEGKDLDDSAVEKLASYLLAYPQKVEHSPEKAARGLHRLVEWGYCSNQILDEYLADRLGKPGLRLGQIPDSTALRLIGYLIDSNKTDLNNLEIRFLQEAVLANERVFNKVKIWAEENNVQSVLSGMILRGLKGTPAAIREKISWPKLARQFKWMIDLFPSITDLPERAVEFAEIYPVTVRALQIPPESDYIEDKFELFFTEFLQFSVLLDQELQHADNSNDFIIKAFAEEAELHTRLLVKTLNWEEKVDVPGAGRFFARYGAWFWRNVAQRREGVFEKTPELLSENPVQQAELLVKLASRYADSGLIDKAGLRLVDIAQQNEIPLPDLIPHLDYFYRATKNTTLKETLSNLREEAYFSLFSLSDPAAGFKDSAIQAGANRWLKVQLQAIEERLLMEQLSVANLQEKNQQLMQLVAEKDQIVRELTSLRGSGGAQSAFEARLNIIKKLTGSVSEFERFLNSQPAESRLIQAILKRLENILTAENVVQKGVLGEIVEYNPALHQFVAHQPSGPGELGVVVEKGYQIQDPAGKWLLLKPIVLKATTG